MSMTPRHRFILLITALYTVMGLLWIFFSDQLLSSFTDLSSMVWLSTAKGVFFIVASAAAFFLAMRAVPSDDAKNSGQPLDLLSAAITPVQRQQWLGYLFAVSLPLLMLLVRSAIAVPIGDRPLLMLFMFPIILTAMLGGLGPGLTATVISALGTAYLVVPPINNVKIAASHDLIQWGFLLVNGVAVSFLSEMLRRSQARTELLNNTLEQRVAKRTVELDAANQELEELNYAIAHNLHTPLRALSGFSQILEEEYADRLDQQGQDYLQEIHQGAILMGQMIEAVVRLSRSSRGVLKHEQVDISALARQIQCFYEQQPDPRQTVRWQIEPGLTAWGDHRQLKLLLRNLLDNGVKFTGKTTDPVIRVYAEANAICIADNGAGFEMRHSGKLFQPFQRLHRQDEFSGIGMGLAIAQRIVQRHNGSLQLSAEPGKGTIACFRLPAAPN